jgi:Cd2+/Zn2+-exporting ATPase
MEKYTLQGLTCADCALGLEKGLSELDSVTSVRVNFAASTLVIDCEDITKVKKRIRELEPGVSIVEESLESTSRKNLVFIIGSFCIFAAGILLRENLHNFPFSWPEYTVFLAAYFLAGRTVLKKALSNSVRGRIFDENFLMTIATAGAILIHELPEAVGVMLFFSVGEYIENVSVNRSRRSIKALLELRPDYAAVKTDRGIINMDPAEVEAGSLVIVKPGERIPLDGVVLEGETTVDTSALTGESLPTLITAGQQVLAGMINRTGVITVEVTKPFKESSISRILDLVVTAAARKADPEKFITKFARVYTPVVVAAALLTAVIPPVVLQAPFYDWGYRALVLLVISCPCALVISIPLGYFGGIGKASKEGILVKGANFLNALTELKTVVFDKTGTLTEGGFTVTQVVPMEGFTKDEVLEYAALTEMYSNHPIAQSIVEAYTVVNKPDITDYEEIPARGVKATINGKTIFVGNDRQLHEEMIDHNTCHIEGTVAHVTVDSVYAGYIVISDQVKEEAQKTVQALRDMGINVAMFTGDSKDTAECVAQHLGILRFYSNLLPEDKVEKLEDMEKNVRRQKANIAFVGDGINDAPVIARADIGIAMGALGSDAAVETADVVIMTDNLYKVVEAVTIARKTSSIIWENIFIVLGIKAVFIFMGVLGMATMWEAVFADVGVALIAVFNAARILRV